MIQHPTSYYNIQKHHRVEHWGHEEPQDTQSEVCEQEEELAILQDEAGADPRVLESQDKVAEVLLTVFVIHSKLHSFWALSKQDQARIEEAQVRCLDDVELRIARSFLL